VQHVPQSGQQSLTREIQPHVCIDSSEVEWRGLERYPGILIGSDGTIVGRSGKHLRAERGRYLVVRTKTSDGQWQMVRGHVLVCEAFHGPKPGANYEVAHGNGVRGDDCATNLRWDTKKGNAADTLPHGTRRTKLTARKVLAIRRAFEAGATIPQIAKRYHVSKGLLPPLLTGRTWSHVRQIERDPQRWEARMIAGRPGEQCPTHKLTQDQVVEIRSRVAAGQSMYSLAPQYGVAERTIADAVHRRTWRHVP
jgi:HNH endonuclease